MYTYLSVSNRIQISQVYTTRATEYISSMYALCLCLFEDSFRRALDMYYSSLTAQYSLICTFDPIEENISVRYASWAKRSTINEALAAIISLRNPDYFYYFTMTLISLRKLQSHQIVSIENTNIILRFITKQESQYPNNGFLIT